MVEYPQSREDKRECWPKAKRRNFLKDGLISSIRGCSEAEGDLCQSYRVLEARTHI